MGKQQYLHNVATSVLGQIGGISFGGSDVYDTYDIDQEDFPKTVWRDYGTKIIGVVGRMGPAARGRISDCGVTMDQPGVLSFWKVNGGGRLGFPDKGGYEVLTLLASYVVAAAIVDILRASVRKMRDEAQAERQLTQAELWEMEKDEPVPGGGY